MEFKKILKLSDPIKYGWGTVTSHIGFFIGLILLSFFIQSIPHASISFLSIHKHELTAVVIILFVLGYVVQAIVYLFTLKLSLDAVDKKPLAYGNGFPNFSKVLNFFLASILYLVLVFLGFILFIVPGIILGLGMVLYPYFLIDKNMTAIDSLKESYRITKGYKGHIFCLLFILGFINMLGAMALFIGLLITIPITWCAFASLYRFLEDEDFEFRFPVCGECCECKCKAPQVDLEEEKAEKPQE
jgi:uncharacterized membrane protein